MRNDGIGRFMKGILSHSGESFVPLHPSLSLFNPLEQIWLSNQLFRENYELFFTPGINPPLLSDTPFVFAIHDLIPLRFSEESSLKKKIYYKTILRLSVKRARRILTVSEFSKGEIINWTNVNPERVIVVGNGVEDRFCPEGSTHDHGAPYLLYVGNTRPHKNVAAAIEGYARSGVANEVDLLLSGRPNSELRAAIQEHDVDDSVRFAHFIPEDELPAYYRGATALIHPSLCEGFGLTVLEALACGTPVAASNAAAIPEVTGEAALLFDPNRVEEIATSIRKIVLEESLRTSLRTRGLERAKQFSWEEVARRTDAALQTAAA